MTSETLASPVVEHPNDGGSPGPSPSPPGLPPPDPLARLEQMTVPPPPSTDPATRRSARRSNRWDRPKPPRDWRWWIGGTGRVLIATGLLLFAFVAYQLWGTGIQQARAQNELESQLAELEATLSTAPSTTVPVTVPVTPTTDPGTTPTAPTTPAPEPAPEPLVEVVEGDPIGLIEIPRIGVSEYLVAGVRTEDLRKGPGHYPTTPLPGELGNAAVAGHRTTYGSPFFDLDQLQPGDELIVTMLGGSRFVYRVTESVVVTPADYDVVLTEDPDVAVLTLTTCHPKYSARERLIISSVLDVEASDPVGQLAIGYGELTPGGDDTVIPGDDPTIPTDTAAVDPGTQPDATAPDDSGPDDQGPDDTATPGAGDTDPDGTDPDGGAAGTGDPGSGSSSESQGATADAFEEGWFSDPAAWPQVAVWGLALIAVSLLASRLSRATRRNWVGLLVGIVPFVVVLYFFFENVNRLLPPNL
jgi:sortase A